jgi:hypothetical protein
LNVNSPAKPGLDSFMSHRQQQQYMGQGGEDDVEDGDEKCMIFSRQRVLPLSNTDEIRTYVEEELDAHTVCTLACVCVCVCIVVCHSEEEHDAHPICVVCVHVCVLLYVCECVYNEEELDAHTLCVASACVCIVVCV